MHFIAQSAPDIRHKIQKATAGPQTPMNDLFQLAYLVFNNGDTVRKTECTQRVCKRPKWLQWLCLLKDHQLGGCPCLANLVLVDHEAHGYTYKASVASVDKRGTGGRTAGDVSFASSQALAEGMPQTPDSRGPSTIDGFAIRRLMGSKAKNGSA